MDEVRVYNRSLSSEEIEQQYYTNLRKYDVDKWNFYTNQSGIANYTASFTGQGGRNFEKYNSSDWYFYSNQSDLSGTYTYYGYSEDAYGNANQTETRVITMDAVDTTPPFITIESPTNTTYSNNTIDLNVTSNEAIDSWWYSNDTGLTNQTFTPNISIAGYPEGLNNITVFANDTAGNENHTIIYFTVDTVPPTINVYSPVSNNTNYSTSTIFFNATSNEAISTWMIDFNGTNNTLSAINTSLVVNDGTYQAKFWANDTAGNFGLNNSIWFTVDTTHPRAEIILPANTTYGSARTQLNYTATDTNLDRCWYSLDSGITNTSITCGTNITGLSSTEGSNVWTVYVNDTAGNLNQTTVYFTVDTISPLVDFVSPTKANGSNVSQSHVYVNVSVTEANEANITFRIYNSTGEVNSTIYTDGTRTINWTNLSDGTYTYNVTVVDSAGNSNTTSTRTITLDSTSPVISLITPADSTSSTTNAYNFTFNVTDDQTILNCSLIFDGLVINTLTNVNNSGGTNGMYNSSLSVATHTWSINCTDIAGNVGSSPTRTLTVNAVTAATSAVSGEGSPIFRPRKEDLARGYEKIMYRNWKIYFKIGDEFHILKVENVTESDARMVISSKAQEVVLSAGEEKQLDLSQDGYYDLLVRVNSINTIWRNKANITIQTIHKKIIPPKKSKTGEGVNLKIPGDEGGKEEKAYLKWLWVAIAGAGVLTLLFLGYKKLRRQKRK